MPDFLRWIIAGATSVVVAGLVFLLEGISSIIYACIPRTR